MAGGSRRDGRRSLLLVFDAGGLRHARHSQPKCLGLRQIPESKEAWSQQCGTAGAVI